MSPNEEGREGERWWWWGGTTARAVPQRLLSRSPTPISDPPAPLQTFGAPQQQSMGSMPMGSMPMGYSMPMGSMPMASVPKN
jgi:hypothetical protein